MSLLFFVPICGMWNCEKCHCAKTSCFLTVWSYYNCTCVYQEPTERRSELHFAGDDSHESSLRERYETFFPLFIWWPFFLCFTSVGCCLKVPFLSVCARGRNFLFQSQILSFHLFSFHIPGCFFRFMAGCFFMSQSSSKCSLVYSPAVSLTLLLLVFIVRSTL